MTTLSIGTNGNNGSWLQLFLFGFLLPSFDNVLISLIALALLVWSTIDHSFVIFDLKLFGHLHHMQAWSVLAASMPQTIARNFRSPPRKNCNS